MAAYTQFIASSPIIKEATEEVVYVEAATEEVIYDKYWMANLVIQAGDPTKPVILMATFVPAKDITQTIDGNDVVVGKEVMKDGPQKRLIVKDLFTKAATNERLKEALESVLSTVNSLAEEQELF